MQRQSFARRLTIAQASEVLFIIPPQRQRPRAHCVQCGRVVSLRHPWLVVWHLSRMEGIGPMAAINPCQGDPWCEDCAHTWFGVNLIAADASASAGEFWGILTRSGAPRIHGTCHGFAYHLRPGWRPTTMTLSVKSERKDG